MAASDFDLAVKYSKDGPATAPSNDQRLRFYAAFKQANKGDAPRRGPSAFDMVGKMKHRAWGALRGKSAAEARAVYVQTMDEVAPKWRSHPCVAPKGAAGGMQLGGKRPLRNQVAIVTGASRGIGREVALALARAGVRVAVVAKSETGSKVLPGSIHSVAAECKAAGAPDAMGVKCDVRKEAEVEAAVAAVVARWGQIDILINNASALWWRAIVDTPSKRYDLMQEVNARGTFMFTRACLPHMFDKYGHVICMSPPLSYARALAEQGVAGYANSKAGMTYTALGVANEGRGRGVAGHALWPATAIESFATKNYKLGDERSWRKASILADCVMAIVQKAPAEFTGGEWIDEDLLRKEGVRDFAKYRCVADSEPPKVEPKSFRVLINSVSKARM